MNLKKLSNVLHAYKNAPDEFTPTNYWQRYQKYILKAIKKMDINEIRSGKYPILATFGFVDEVYYYHPYMPLWKKLILKFIHNFIIKDRAILPYELSLNDIREMSYRHCENLGKLTNAKSISSIEMSSFGNPKDIFEVNKNKYSISFLNYFIRYCFVHKNICFKGDEVIVELGSGAGQQIEILKKLYPNLTILCFDLPLQIFLCEEYLSRALNNTNITSIDQTLNWTDLSKLKKGHIHFLGNWQFSLLKKFKFDLFWNAASFGEMEPNIVKNYLSYIKENVKWIYLLQARYGKETTGKVHVKKPILFEDYNNMLSDYTLKEQQDAYASNRRLSPETGGYFEAMWTRE